MMKTIYIGFKNCFRYGDDVRYCVLRSYSRIIVCWYLVQANERRTKIHSYHLAADHQTVANISEIQPVQHYVSSLHNIEGIFSIKRNLILIYDLRLR